MITSGLTGSEAEDISPPLFSATKIGYHLYIGHKLIFQEETHMKRLISKKTLAAYLTAAMLLTGCANSSPAVQTEPVKNDPLVKTEIKLEEVADKKYDEDKLNAEYGRYSFELMREIAANASKKGNVMISPASIMMALDMVEAGARGETLKQLADFFAKDTDPLEQQAFAAEMMQRINYSRKIEFVCANAIWSDSEVLGDKINSDYRDYIRKTFDAEFNNVKFNKETHNIVNKWVDEKTNHMIPTLFDQPFDPNTVMVLVNAIKFEAKWKTGYTDDQIVKREFRGADGNINTDMLSSKEKGYFETDKATGFIKYYEGEEYAFVAILPKDENANANEFINSFTYEDYKKFVDSRSSADVRAIMPEFKSDYSVGLNDILKNLGVTDLFDDGKADLKGIANPVQGNLYVTHVVHKTHIEVDRKGTKAAAATGISIGVKSAKPMEDEIKLVICDRPYVYAIVDTLTMNPVFIGTVNSVK